MRFRLLSIDETIKKSSKKNTQQFSASIFGGKDWIISE